MCAQTDLLLSESATAAAGEDAGGASSLLASAVVLAIVMGANDTAVRPPYNCSDFGECGSVLTPCPLDADGFVRCVHCTPLARYNVRPPPYALTPACIECGAVRVWCRSNVCPSLSACVHWSWCRTWLLSQECGGRGACLRSPFGCVAGKPCVVSCSCDLAWAGSACDVSVEDFEATQASILSRSSRSYCILSAHARHRCCILLN